MALSPALRCGSLNRLAFRIDNFNFHRHRAYVDDNICSMLHAPRGTMHYPGSKGNKERRKNIITVWLDARSKVKESASTEVFRSILIGDSQCQEQTQSWRQTFDFSIKHHQAILNWFFFYYLSSNYSQIPPHHRLHCRFIHAGSSHPQRPNGHYCMLKSAAIAPRLSYPPAALNKGASETTSIK